MSTIDTRDLLEACGTGESYNAELLREILGHMIRQNTERMASARAAVAAGQRVELAELAHAVKGSASLVGAQHLADLGRRLESDAATATLDALGEAVTALESEFHAVVAALRARHPDAM